MTTSKSIDFAPDLFGEPADHASATAPLDYPLHTKTRLRRWPAALLLLGAAGVAVAAVLSGRIDNTADQAGAPDSETALHQIPALAGVIARPVPVGAITRPAMQSWCVGTEVLCSKVLTSDPAQSLRRIVAAMPRDTARQYTVRVSITPMEEVPSQD